MTHFKIVLFTTVKILPEILLTSLIMNEMYFNVKIKYYTTQLYVNFIPVFPVVTHCLLSRVGPLHLKL